MPPPPGIRCLPPGAAAARWEGPAAEDLPSPVANGTADRRPARGEPESTRPERPDFAEKVMDGSWEAGSEQTSGVLQRPAVPRGTRSPIPLRTESSRNILS